MGRYLILYKCPRYDEVPYRDRFCCGHRHCMIKIDLDEFDPNKTDWINEIDIPEEGWDELKNNYEEYFGRNIMRKQDLKDWHFVITRNGEQWKVQIFHSSFNENGRVVLINMADGDYHNLSRYNSDMTHRDKREYDIMKVYSIDDPYQLWKLMTDRVVVLTDPGIELIWERPKEATELTVAQIEELLGYPVKVVK